MRQFPERLKRLGATLADAQSEAEGGWAAELDDEDASLSIVATAQAIEMLRFLGHRYDSASIQNGLGYLATNARRHQVDPARGPYTRYAAYSLWGITRYASALRDDQWRAGMDYAVGWLEENALGGGAWGALGAAHARKEPRLSLAASLPAVTALDRLQSDRAYAERAQALTQRARDTIAEQAVRDRKNLVRWEGTSKGAEGGATAMAALALADGDREHQALARQAISWLLARSETWQSRVHADHQHNVYWRIVSFSLGLRAVLHPIAPTDPHDPRLAAAFEHLERLWDPTNGAWGIEPSEAGTTTGSFAVVTAVRALKKSWRFDPFGAPVYVAPPRRRKRESQGRRRRPFVLQIWPSSRRVKVEDRLGEELLVEQVPEGRLWTVVQAVARRHASASSDGAGDSLRQRSLLQADLAALIGGEFDTARRYVDEVNAWFNRHIAPTAFLTSVVEDVVLPEDELLPPEQRQRFGLVQFEVRIVEEAGGPARP